MNDMGVRLCRNRSNSSMFMSLNKYAVNLSLLYQPECGGDCICELFKLCAFCDVATASSNAYVLYVWLKIQVFLIRSLNDLVVLFSEDQRVIESKKLPGGFACNYQVEFQCRDFEKQ